MNQPQFDPVMAIPVFLAVLIAVCVIWVIEAKTRERRLNPRKAEPAQDKPTEPVDLHSQDTISEDIPHKAKIGDWVKVVRLFAYDNMNTIGSIMQVTGYNDTLTVCDPRLPGLLDLEFVVLEGYSPPTNPSHDPEPVAAEKPDPLRGLKRANQMRLDRAAGRAMMASREIRDGLPLEQAYVLWGYKSKESLCDSLSRYGYRSDGTRKEAANG